MTGRYKINLNSMRFWEPERVTAARWSRFVAICRSLAAQRLHYSVWFNLNAPEPHILITAHGTPAKTKPKPLVLKRTLIAALTPDQCRKRAIAASGSLDRLKENLTLTMAEWRKSRYADSGKRHCECWGSQITPEQRRQAGRLLSKLIARNRTKYFRLSRADYQRWDELLGFRLERSAERRARDRDWDDFAYIVRRICGGNPDRKAKEQCSANTCSAAEMIRSFQVLKADLEYWRELEAISGHRQHFKPGRTDENAYADDEVAA